MSHMIIETTVKNDLKVIYVAIFHIAFHQHSPVFQSLPNSINTTEIDRDPMVGAFSTISWMRNYCGI